MVSPSRILLVTLFASSGRGANAIIQFPSVANHHDVFGAAYIGDILNHILEGKKRFDSALEFGSSGGYIVGGLDVQDKYGVEENALARQISNARNPHVKVWDKTSKIDPSLRADVIFTASALEHVQCPLCELKDLKKLLAPFGVMIVGLRNDGLDRLQTFNERGTDEHHHIYTWNALLLGNLLKYAGFEPCSVVREYASWWKVDLDTYNKNKFQYCRKAMRTGRKKEKENIWAVAVRPEDKLICQNYTRKLMELDDCKYLEKRAGDHAPLFRKSWKIIPP